MFWIKPQTKAESETKCRTGLKNEYVKYKKKRKKITKFNFLLACSFFLLSTKFA